LNYTREAGGFYSTQGLGTGDARAQRNMLVQNATAAPSQIVQ